MAFRLDYNNSEYLYTDNALALADPITVSIWFNASNWGVGGPVYGLFGLSNVATSTQYYWLGVLRSAKQVRMRKINGGLIGTATSINAVGIEEPNTWHHACGTCASTTSRSVVLDGDIANKGTDGTNVSDFTPTKTTLGAFLTIAPGGYHHGDIGEFGLWSAALDDDEVVRLAAGASPLLVRPASLLAYYPLIRTNRQTIGDYTMIHAKAQVVAEHPRILYPFSSRRGAVPPPTIHAGRLVNGPLLKSKFQLGLVA